MRSGAEPELRASLPESQEPWSQSVPDGWTAASRESGHPQGSVRSFETMVGARGPGPLYPGPLLNAAVQVILLVWPTRLVASQQLAGQKSFLESFPIWLRALFYKSVGIQEMQLEPTA